ncbi:MAG TPA: hydrogenase formation protein HypD [Spirochaetota bacterium]|nr:hydrogenase formation protein HypD [Spirochaetota bacterium]
MNNETVHKLADALRNHRLDAPMRIMEVCGTHTTEFFRSGVRDIFPAHLTLVDGPGCPVCVTANAYLDTAIEIGRAHGVIIATFGDMMKVPSSYSSLAEEKATGMDVRVVYSPMDALEIARHDPAREVVFVSVGFETTAPTEAATVIAARDAGIRNFSILPGNKLTVPAVEALLSLGEVHIDGFILPGHVSAIIGSEAWRPIPEQFGKPCVVAGFETADLITGTLALMKMIASNDRTVANEYARVVRPGGNPTALSMMRRVFEPDDAEWRGIGVIPGSGLAVRDEFSRYDGFKKFPVTPPPVKEHPGCRCGELLRGLIAPTDCALFGAACRPERPVGPCMVSTEGPCAAFYKYGGFDR